MNKKSFNTKTSWEDRYQDEDNLATSGTFTHTHHGNINFYLTKYKALDRVLAYLDASLADKSILEAAGGTGQFIDYYLKRGAKKIHITDFAENAIDRIRKLYAGDERVFAETADLSVPKFDWPTKFDFVFLMEAVFLLKTDEDVRIGLSSLSSALNEGGYLVISDVFPKNTSSSDYVIRRSKLFFEETLNNEGLTIRGYVPQTFVFNRKLFGRFQTGIEKNTGKFLYYLDQIALRFGLTPPEDSWADIKYLIAQKQIVSVQVESKNPA